MKERPTGHEPITNKKLMQYAAIVASSLVLVQGYTALLAGNRFTAVTMILLAGVATYAFVFYVQHRVSLRMRAYAGFFVHVLTYLLVNGSFWIHSGVLFVSNQGIPTSAWMVPVLSMSVFWGIGLIVHTVGVLLSRGYDDVAV